MPPTKKEASKKKQETSGAKRRLDFGGKDEESKEEKKSFFDKGKQRESRLEAAKGGSKNEDTFLTPQKKRPRTIDTYLEEESKTTKKKSEEPPYVPRYIHKNVEYKRQGEATISDTKRKTFDLVKKHYVIPDDFEQNRKYGPLSGSCYEERAIAAYALNLLKPKSGTAIEICSFCADLGHRRTECSQLI